MKLFYREYGKGEPLIILHGLYGSSDNWITIARSLENLFRVIVVDQRNHGQSAHSEDHNYQVMVDDLVELYNDLGIDKAAIIGHSMGGKVAMLFTSKYPDNVRSLVVVDIAPWGYEDYEGKYFSWFQEHTKIVSSLKSVPIKTITQRAEAEAILSFTVPSEKIRQFLLKNLTRGEDGKFVWKLNLDVISRSLEILMEEAVNKKNIIETRTLFVRGEFSNYIPMSRIEDLKLNFPNSIIKTIQDADHWVHAEKPEEFKSLLLDFLKKKTSS